MAYLQMLAAAVGFLVLATRQRDDIKPPVCQLVAVACSVACGFCFHDGLSRIVRDKIARDEET